MRRTAWTGLRPWWNAVTLVCCLAACAGAVVKTWTGAVDAKWSTAGNWSPSGVPLAADTADFDNSGVVCTLDVSPEVACLRVKNDEVVNPDPAAFPTVTVGELYLDTGGILRPGAAEVRVGGDFYIDGRARPEFRTEGCRVVLTGNGSVDVNGPTVLNHLSCLIQQDGVTTTFLGGWADTLQTGDATSTITGTGFAILDRLIDNGTLWNNGTGSFNLSFQGDTLYGGTYDDIIVEVYVSDSIILNGDLSAGQLNVARRHCPSCAPCTLHTRGHDITVGKLRVGTHRNRPGLLLLEQGSVVRCSGDLEVEHANAPGNLTGILDDGSSTDSVIIGGNIVLDTATTLDATGTVFVLEASGGAKHTLQTKGATVSNITLRNSADTIQLLDSLTMSGTLRLSGGVLDLDGQNLRAGRMRVSNGIPETFAGLAGCTLTVADTAILNGTSETSRLGLNPGAAWYIDAGVMLRADNATIGYSNATNATGMASLSCVDNGNNVNWMFDGQELTITRQPVGDTVVEGESVTLQVVAAGGAGTLTYQWRKDGADIADAVNASLTIASATFADTGAYVVVVYDASDSVVSDTVRVGVTPACTPVSIVEAGSSSGDTLVNQGDTLRLAVTAEGTSPSYAWLKDGVVLAGQTAAVLVVPEAALDDSGYYQYIVSNACSADTSDSIKLSIDPMTAVAGVSERRIAGLLLPTGAAQLRCRLYDARGRLVWRGTGATAAIATTIDGLLGRNGSAYRLRPGAYVLRIDALGITGNVIGGERMRLMLYR